MFRVKGKNQHVMPHEHGWCVIDEANLMVLQTFEHQDEAMAYARQCADIYESDVLTHETPYAPGNIPTVSRPQREFIRGRGVGRPGSMHGINDAAV